VLRWRSGDAHSRCPLRSSQGFLWAAGFAQLRMAERLAPELEGRDLEIVGVVAGLPAIGERGVRFEFEVESADAKLPQKILLSWYRSALAPGADSLPALLEGGIHAGERWRFTVRLRRPHGNLNPHGFDYEAWLIERGIGATGYVRPEDLSAAPWRTRLRRRSHRAGARARARPVQAPARGNAGGGNPRSARRRRPALDLERGMAALQSHRRHAPDEHLGIARDARVGLVRLAGRGALAPRAGARLALPARKAAALAAILRRSATR
jgi:hypothetical protein